MLFDEAITRYVNDLTVRRGPYTVRNQAGCLQTFKAFLENQHPEDHAWTVEDALTLCQCRAFMATLAKRGLRPKTLKGYVIALRGLIRFLHDEEVLPDDWSTKLQGPRVTERRADPLTQEEWQHFLNAIPGLTPAQLRDRLFFQLLLDTGLRLNEIISLSLPDIRLDQQLLIIRHGKNDKDRTIPLTEVRSQQLKDYIEQVRPAFVQPTSPPNLFLSELGLPLHPCTIRDKVRLYARRAGIQRRVYPHMFRATFATRLDLAQVNLTVVQELMGHAKSRPRRYVVDCRGTEKQVAIANLLSAKAGCLALERTPCKEAA